MKIEVTQEDINNGVPTNHYSCPIARAIKRSTKSNDVRVYREKICVGDDFFVLPPTAYKFITAFDAEKPVQPFAFDMERMKVKKESQ